MTIDFDLTFVLQMVLFATLIVVLKPLLFDPVLQILVERERRTDGARAEARQLQEKAGELLTRYERELSRVREVAREERDRERSETAKLEANSLAEARAAADSILQAGRAQIEQECSRVHASLDRGAVSLARSLAMSVLGVTKASMLPPPSSRGTSSAGGSGPGSQQ